jgi:hypothetical protein
MSHEISPVGIKASGDVRLLQTKLLEKLHNSFRTFKS